MPTAFLSGSAFVASFSHMVWRHGTVAADATNQSLEQCTELVSNHDSTGSTAVLQLLLHLFPELDGYNRVVFAFVNLFLVANLAEVGDVREQLEQ